MDEDNFDIKPLGEYTRESLVKLSDIDWNFIFFKLIWQMLLLKEKN